MLIDDTSKIECLLQSLENYISAKQSCDKARDNYDGYSWGYWGRDYIERVEECAKDFQKRLDDIIGARLLSIIDEKVSSAIKDHFSNL